MSAWGSLKRSILQAFLLCPRPLIINPPDTHNSFTIMSNTIQLQPKQAIPTNGKQSVYLIPLSTKSPSSQFFTVSGLKWHLQTCTSIRCVISIHVDYKNASVMPFICVWQECTIISTALAWVCLQKTNLIMKTVKCHGTMSFNWVSVVSEFLIAWHVV